ncbi:T9SS type A sorting domain-containing protein [candidate division KSB1 bacterium]|nr:T9SS type A sorting domain-containing protein [candidate division KSB1 bacterium]
MINRKIVFINFFLFCALSLFGQKVIKIDITYQGWTDTGIDFSPGDKITIMSYGFASTSGKTIPQVIERWGGPSGPSWVQASGLAPSDHLAPNAPNQRLIGKLGSNGTAFAVGDAYSSTITSGGRLYMAFNDQKGSYTDNFGYFISFIFKNPSTTVMIRGDDKQDKDFSISQNYPNPFNPITRIDYFVTKPSKVKITIFDKVGREVKTLINQEHLPGSNTIIWNGRNEDNNKVATGVYFYEIKAEGFESRKRMILLK